MAEVPTPEEKTQTILELCVKANLGLSGFQVMLEKSFCRQDAGEVKTVEPQQLNVLDTIIVELHLTVEKIAELRCFVVSNVISKIH